MKRLKINYKARAEIAWALYFWRKENRYGYFIRNCTNPYSV